MNDINKEESYKDAYSALSQISKTLTMSDMKLVMQFTEARVCIWLYNMMPFEAVKLPDVKRLNVKTKTAIRDEAKRTIKEGKDMQFLLAFLFQSPDWQRRVKKIFFEEMRKANRGESSDETL